MASKNFILGSGQVDIPKDDPYVFVEYPKWIFHKELPAKTVKSKEEFEKAKELGYDLHSEIFKKVDESPADKESKIDYSWPNETKKKGKKK